MENIKAKRFKLIRKEDISGISGVGIVAEGCVFENGKAVVVWRGDHSSTNIYESITEVVYIHGHNGKTEVVWID